MLKIGKYIVIILFLILVIACLSSILTDVGSKVTIKQLPGKYVYNATGFTDSIYIMEDFKYEHVCYIGNNVFRQTGEWEFNARANVIDFEGYVFYNEGSKYINYDEIGYPSAPWSSRVKRAGNEIRLYYASELNLYYKKELTDSR